MKKFLLLLTIIVSMVRIQHAKAEVDLLPEGRYWNYELSERIGFSNCIYKTLNGCHFEGTETIGDHTYKVFKDGEGSTLGLLRQEGLKVYRYVDEKMREGELEGIHFNMLEFPEEVLLFDLGLGSEETVDVVRLDYVSYPYPIYFQTEIRLLGLDYVEIDKVKCERQYTPNLSYSDPIRTFIFVVGIGPMDGIFSDPSVGSALPANGSHYEPWKIVDVRDSDGNVIFRYNDFFLTDNGVAGITPKFSEDWIWEYYTQYSATEHGMSRMKFDGTAEIGGKTYQCFRTISDLRWEGTENEDHSWNDVTEVKVCEVPSDVSYLRLEDRCVWRLFEAGTEFDKGSVSGDVPFEGTLTEPTELCLFNQIPTWGDKIWLERVAPGKWKWYKSAVFSYWGEDIEYIPHEKISFYVYQDFTWLTDVGPLESGTLGVPEPGMDIMKDFTGTVLNGLYNSKNDLIYKNLSKTVPEVEAVGYLHDDAEAQPEYFTLDGLRVAEPRSGQLLIRRQGSKVEKVLM